VQLKPLGHSNLLVSEIGFGCMSLPLDDDSSARLLHRALDAGVTFFDTADFYQQGANETMVGRAFAGMRDQVVIASKVGNRWNPDGTTWRWDPSPQWIAQSIRQTLTRLQTDHLDLYQLHGGTLDDPIDDIIAAFELLREEGLIRHYGISSIRPNVIREWVARSQMTSVMMQYSLLDRRPEEAAFELLQQNNIAVIARGPLARGLLASKPAEKHLDVSADDVAHVQCGLDQFTTATRTRAQVALRFALAHPAVATVVPGASTDTQVNENFSTCEPLDDEAVEKLRRLSEPGRYDAHR
jgi:aryl-alcohol dehydrogenase-like predicted oxidoreductase